MNYAVMIGRLTADVKMTQTQTTAVARYTLAVDRQGKEGADYIPVVAFGKGAEFASKYFSKGQRVAVSGRMQSGSYEKEGRKIYTLDLIADRQEFADAKKQTGDGFVPAIEEELPFA